MGWYAIDLDGTLAHYDGWRGPECIGDPVPAMLALVKKMLADGKDVRIFTARVHTDDTAARNQEVSIARGAIGLWLEKHLGRRLPVVNAKDFGLITLYDDRAVQVEMNTGRIVGDGSFTQTQSDYVALLQKFVG